MPPADLPPIIPQALTPRERQRLRLLALRSRVHPGAALRPMADVLFDYRLQHGSQLPTGRAVGLPRRRTGR